MNILIKNGHIIDPSQGIDRVGDILIEDGKIKEVHIQGKEQRAKPPPTPPSPSRGEGKGEGESLLSESRIIDAFGLIVIPGLIDMHVHLREPGFEYKETIKTGTMAAVKGGFTTVCCMPNTFPVNDNASVTELIIRKAAQEGLCTVFPIGAITKGQKGEELAEIGTMRKEGCIAFSDDGQPVMNSLIMRRALEYSKAFNVPVISHCEDLTLSEGGVMNEGLLSVTLGLSGIPAEAEMIMVYRDISLAELTGGRLHIAHVSTQGSVKLIRDAKKRGINVTAETCPHYFNLTQDAIKDFNTNAKVSPPLRTERDIEAIKEGLRDGTIDIIATDHAPHHKDEKQREFDMAPFGISGLETALSLSLKLVQKGILTINQLIEKMTLNPAKILRIDKGTLKVGSDADIVILDINKEYEVESERFASKGKNTPFEGWVLEGMPILTIYRGRAYER
ncbi:MAG: dihydroorotase [Nitrospirae bacterium CG_4_10_14_0_8_um_filter_41_23]|nr:MAG: dihydroorotase [Nitrospirae bacterium CG2_30_41_42]PIQ93495.1 MAG: dihydroorotase [Nitrospirae bacterium CG11_big_fil_rev_8_21_14_0_20_41_14]PIV43435.1 MAG: dihydroorotase [Nitrospirae bacterium CG02_land_8_20_14_3_00_41_53]PIW87911.1 MAG: dihydroorotase [Nitrospirae bacterium CG_4_8_14_3_um_filter_41_47]PIY87061.1 MAG: dihydroorotase [Nitrospirae bacterium CG_4_10_14_0_8_um_filter_41_23]PJA79067.1 MAG: dihydroorotase [Nitrospirae bacterium CG_4_9_14_3_um_filter_41_27]